MKTIITQAIAILAFVLVATLAHANGVKGPGKAKAMAKTPPPVVRPAEDRNSCLNRVASECEAKNWTKIGKRACYRVKSRACR